MAEININGIKTFYKEKGDGSALLILHGWGSSSDSWEGVQDIVADGGHKVIALDLPGFGQTQEPDPSWSISDYADFVKAFAKEVGLQRFTLLGHSFGGRIAIDYAARYSEDLENLILVAAAGVVRHKEAKVNIFRAFTKVGDKVFSLPGLSYFKDIVRKIWYKFTGESDYKKSSPVMKKIMGRVLEENLRVYLPRISTRTLILWGDKDTMTPLSDGEILNKEITNSYMHIFEGEPHAIQRTIPDRLSKKINDFIK